MDDNAVAWLCTGVACLGFGSNYLGAKKCDTRHGQFFSLMVAVGIFLVGFVQWCLTDFYKFEPIAMLGGLIWAIGNLFVPFIINRCGLGVGQLVWGATNMLTGWATSTFGLFGMDKTELAHPAMNYVGVALSVLALLVFTQMKDDKKAEEVKIADDGSLTAGTEGATGKPKGGFVLGFIVALIAGVFFGSNFDPCTILQQTADKNSPHYDPNSDHNPNSMAYVISHFTGIIGFTVIAFGVFKVSSPTCYIGKDVVLPGLYAGVLWGIAQVCWFKANSVLSPVVAFPIIVGIPGVIAALWGVALFGENRSSRNLILLGVIICIQATSLILIAVSRGN